MRPILLLEDDESFGYILSEYLAMNNLKSVWAKSSEEALELLDQHDFQLALLDIMLPGVDGFGFARQLGRLRPELPFIFISAKSLKIDQLKAYKLGAFDYITKPIDEEILMAKIKVLTTRSSTLGATASQEEYQIGLYRFRPKEQSLIIDSRITQLTTRESELLEMLSMHQNKLLSRKHALGEIWGSTDEFSRKSMDVFISHLRSYLSSDPQVEIKNVHGKGFILKC